MAWDTSNRKAELPYDWTTRRVRVLRRDGYVCQARDSIGVQCGAPANQVTTSSAATTTTRTTSKRCAAGITLASRAPKVQKHASRDLPKRELASLTRHSADWFPECVRVSPASGISTGPRVSRLRRSSAKHPGGVTPPAPSSSSPKRHRVCHRLRMTFGFR